MELAWKFQFLINCYPILEAKFLVILGSFNSILGCLSIFGYFIKKIGRKVPILGANWSEIGGI